MEKIKKSQNLENITTEPVQKNKGGRPKKIIDFETCEKLSMIQCTIEEIAAILDVSVDTLYRSKRFSKLHKKGLDKGRMSLRRQQFKLANEGNPTMLVWLGKQYLGQKEKTETDINAKVESNNRMPLRIFALVNEIGLARATELLDEAKTVTPIKITEKKDKCKLITGGK